MSRISLSSARDVRAGDVSEISPLIRIDTVSAISCSSEQKDVSIWRLLNEAKTEIRVLSLATVFLFIGSLSFLGVPRLAGQLVDACMRAEKEGSAAAAKADVNRHVILVLVVLLVGGVAAGLRSWLFGCAAQRVMTRLRCQLFRSLMRQEVAFFDANRTGELLNRLSEDTRLMKDAGTISFAVALRALTSASLGIVLMLVTSWQLTMLTVATMPVVISAFRVYAFVNKRYMARQLEASAHTSTVAEESFGSLRTVRSFAQEGTQCARYAAACADVERWGLKSAAAGGVFTGGAFLVSAFSLVCILWFGAHRVINGAMTLGQLNTFALYAIFVATEAGDLVTVFSSIVQALGAGRRVFELMDRVPSMPRPGSLAPPPGDPRGAALQLVGVRFVYPTRPGAWVLDGIDLSLQPGRRLALVGPSGGGKSTIVSLVQRFYDPTSGSVLLDGVGIHLLSHSWLHSTVALVSQEPVLFADSIFFNVAFGLQGDGSGGGGGGLVGPDAIYDTATARRVEEAAKLANAHDFIRRLPEGYHTLVGERGVRLSGGQKQRIAIARALVTRPRLLLLDEATSALDAESEFQVQAALDAAAQGRSVLVIAHRLSTVQDADEVAVIQGGRVSERGSHHELLAAGGQYANLVKRQLLAANS